jgi:tRNA(His) guanylyltransferase
MVEVTKFLVKETGALTGYTQSDEISLLWMQKERNEEIFFSGKVFKMVSHLSSLATGYFNRRLWEFIPEKIISSPEKFPTFDARVMNIPTKAEAANYFLWRERDATKNSITMAAQCYFSHAQLQGQNSSDKQTMLWKNGVNWNNYPDFFKRGTYVQRIKQERVFSEAEISLLPANHEARTNPNLIVFRSQVVVVEAQPLDKLINKVDFIFADSVPLSA